MTATTWAQHGEDVLAEAIVDAPAGVYVEVGAHDGVSLSNTYRLEKAGWQGICIEPHPVHGERLRENRPGATVVQSACTDTPRGPMTFYVEPSGLLSGLAPLDEDEIARRYRRRGDLFPGLRAVEVPTTTLDEVLTANGLRPSQVDFMSIDVEGTELDVLRGLTLEEGGPTVLVVEANDHAHARQVYDHILGRADYVYAGRCGVNAWFCRPDVVHRLRALRVPYHREGTPTHSGTARLRRGLPRRSLGLLVRQLVHRLRQPSTTS